MTTKDTYPLLEALADTQEVVIRRRGEGDGQLAVWRAAADDARTAYTDWCRAPSTGSYTGYLAAEDQADAALASLGTAAAAA